MNGRKRRLPSYQNRNSQRQVGGLGLGGLGESREGSGSCHFSGDQCVPKTKMFAIFLLPSRQRKQ